MPSTVGATLRQERVRQGRSHADVARELGVPKATVVDIEEGKLAPGLRTQAYVRVYARQLGLDAEGLLRRLVEQEERVAVPVAPGATTAPPAAPGPSRLPRPAGDGAAPALPVAPLGAAAGAGAGRRGRGVPRRVALLVGIGLLTAVVTAVAVVALSSRGDGDVRLAAPAAPADTTDAAPVAPAPDAPGGVDPTVAPAPGAPGGVDPTVAPAPGTTSPAVHDRVDAAASGRAAAPEAADPPGQAPEDTTVQVLHAGADEAVLADVTGVLEDLGYEVVLVSLARLANDVTTVYAADGWESEALGLRAREPRFAAVAPNPGFTADVGLHVGVGPDWQVEPPGA